MKRPPRPVIIVGIAVILIALALTTVLGVMRPRLFPARAEVAA